MDAKCCAVNGEAFTSTLPTPNATNQPCRVASFLLVEAVVDVLVDVAVNDLVDALVDASAHTHRHTHTRLPLLNLEGSQPVTHRNIVTNTNRCAGSCYAPHTRHIVTRHRLLTLHVEDNSFDPHPSLIRNQIKVVASRVDR